MAWAERSQAIAATFNAEGYAVVEELADERCLEELGPIYDGLLDGSIPCATTERKLGGLTSQIIMPHLAHAGVKDNAAVRNALEIARAIQGVDEPEYVFSMLIFKPPGHPHETPWHQDMSYVGSPTLYPGARIQNNRVLTFWLAMDDVAEDMGCMEFIPRVQEAPMPEHYVYSGEPMRDDRLLAIRSPEKVLDLNRAVKCPLKAGSATIHGYGTPHFTAPNRSTRGRRAFIFSFNHPSATREIHAVLQQGPQSNAS